MAGGLAAAAIEWGLHEGIHLIVGQVAPIASAQILQPSWGALLLPTVGGLVSALVVLIMCP